MSKIPVFDIGDTLLPSKKLQQELINEKLEKNGYHDVDLPINEVRIYTPSEIRKFFQDQNIELDANPEEIAEEYMERAEKYMEENGVFELLRDCNEEFGEIGFISDNSLEGKEFYERIFDKYGVNYSGVIVSEEIGSVKPDKGIFQAFLDSRREESSEFVYIGNNVKRDSAAEKVGMKFIWTNQYHVFGQEYDGSRIEELTLKNIREVVK